MLKVSTLACVRVRTLALLLKLGFNKIRFKGVRDDFDVNMVLDLAPVPGSSWKDKLLRGCSSRMPAITLFVYHVHGVVGS